MSNQELISAGNKTMDETDQAIERSKQTEKMGRVVNELDTIQFSIQKPLQLIKEIERQVRVSDPASRVSQIDLDISRHRIFAVLSTHTADELLPVSGKVIAFDVDLPVKQAFHILHDLGIPMAPLWDFSRAQFVGILSALDFILIMKEIRMWHQKASQRAEGVILWDIISSVYSHLSNNNLGGLLPNLTGLNVVNYLDVSDYLFNALDFPSWIPELQSLTTLVMENTRLQGPVPAKLFSLLQLLTVAILLIHFTQKPGYPFQIMFW